MLILYDSQHAQAFRRMFRRLPPYTLYNLKESRAAEMAQREAARAAGFAQRTQMGVAPSDRMGMHPTMTLDPAANSRFSGGEVLPEVNTGRIMVAQS